VDEYRYKAIPLSPIIASEFIPECPSMQSAPIKRADLVKYVAERHQNGGGIPGVDSARTIKKALSRLIDEGRVIRQAYGYYSLSPRNAQQPTPAAGSVTTPAVEAAERDKSVRDDLLLIDSNLRALRSEDAQAFLQIREKFFENGCLDISDLRRTQYFKSLIRVRDADDDIAF
jgi:hypothetical protein